MPEITYLLARIRQARGRIREHANSTGAVTLEWMVIAALLFLIALAAATKLTQVVRTYMGKIH